VKDILASRQYRFSCALFGFISVAMVEKVEKKSVGLLLLFTHLYYFLNNHELLVKSN